MSVAVVIPNWNGGELLARCLDALHAASGVDEVIVVDDGSTDGSAAAAGAAGARVLASRGRGFAAAVNRGVASTTAEYVLLLNSDAFVEPDTVALLAEGLDADPGLAVCAAGLVDERGDRSKSHGDLLTLRRAYEIVLDIPGRQPPEQPGTQAVSFVPLACALVRRDAYAAVGGLDEGYRFYFEDGDFCWRLAQAGWRIAVRWDATAVHVGGGSSSRRDPSAWLVPYHTARLRYLRTRYPRGWVGFAVVWPPHAALHATLWLSRATVARARGDKGRARTAGHWANAYVRTAYAGSRPRDAAEEPALTGLRPDSGE